jgi:vacuolar-type H+-ATPase subunit E/Vma4
VSDQPGEATAAGAGVRADEGDRLAALADRVRRLAETAGHESLRTSTEQARQLVADADARAESTIRQALEEERAHLRENAQRELQNARLDGRARLTAEQWSQLTAVLDEAAQAMTRTREREPERYVAALVRWFEQARAQLPPGPVVVRANAADLQRLRGALGTDVAEWVEDQLPDGFVVGTPDGNTVCDQTLARRRSRHATELQLAAADILFGGDPEEGAQTP